VPSRPQPINSTVLPSPSRAPCYLFPLRLRESRVVKDLWVSRMNDMGTDSGFPSTRDDGKTKRRADPLRQILGTLKSSCHHRPHGASQ
jgi:hypothetical protein